MQLTCSFAGCEVNRAPDNIVVRIEKGSRVIHPVMALCAVYVPFSYSRQYET